MKQYKKIMELKKGKFPYFFLSIWSLIFSPGFLLSFGANGKVKSFGKLEDASYSNTLIFLTIGAMGLIFFVANLTKTNWISIDNKEISIRNLFRKKRIDFNEVSKIEEFGTLMSKIKTKSNKEYYIHCRAKELKGVFQQHL